MNIVFTVEQLNSILAYCDQMPYRFAKPLIDQIQAIAEPQVKAQVEPVAVGVTPVENEQ
jgi:hypothetical protein